jgi:hypothetical protein
MGVLVQPMAQSIYRSDYIDAPALDQIPQAHQSNLELSRESVGDLADLIKSFVVLLSKGVLRLPPTA